MKAGEGDGRLLQHRLSAFLLSYRTTLHTVTNEAPCRLFLQRKLRIKLNLLRIPTDQRVTLKQVEQKQQHDVQVRERVFIPKDLVMARNFSEGPKWLPGFIQKCCGPLSYIVELQDGRNWRRHVEHLVR